MSGEHNVMELKNLEHSFCHSECLYTNRETMTTAAT